MNVIISNILEPRLMGRELGISSVVLLLSLLFWGWVLGPIGLFLSVPLTMVLIVALHASPHTRPVAILLGSDARRPDESAARRLAAGAQGAGDEPGASR